MRKRQTLRENEAQRLQMTPLIDVVFLLLTFFIMTFKIIEPEGDFDIKMPLQGPSQVRIETPDRIEMLKVRMLSDEQGNLADIRVGEVSFGANPTALREYVKKFLAESVSDGDREKLEAELDCDDKLKYQHTIEGFTAISGYLSPEGGVIPLIENIKITD